MNRGRKMGTTIDVICGALLLFCLAAAGCAGSQSSSAVGNYRYGDMFEETADRSSPPPAPPRASSPSPVVAVQARRSMSFATGGAASVDDDMDYEMDESEPAPEPMADEGMASGGGGFFGGPGSGDSGGEESAAMPDDARAEAPAQPAPAEEPPATTPASQGQQNETRQVTDTPTSGPLLIYTADLNLAVHEVREKIDAVVEVTDDLGGFLANQNDTSVVIRVPAGRFREALERIEALGDVLNRRVQAQDVSEQVRDTRIRLRNAIQMRDRLAELLERATTVPDSLTIERELERLTQTIELLRGQMLSLQDRISYSTITVRFQPVRVDQEVPRERFQLPFPWLNQLGLANLMELRR